MPTSTPVRGTPRRSQKPRAVTVFAAAFLAGAAAAVVVNRALDLHLEQSKPQVETDTIFVALRSLPQGSTVTVWDVGLRPWPKAMLPETALRATDSFKGLVLKHPLREGQPLLSIQLAPAPQGTDTALPANASQPSPAASTADADLWAAVEPVVRPAVVPPPAPAHPAPPVAVAEPAAVTPPVAVAVAPPVPATPPTHAAVNPPATPVESATIPPRIEAGPPVAAAVAPAVTADPIATATGLPQVAADAEEAAAPAAEAVVVATVPERMPDADAPRATEETTAEPANDATADGGRRPITTPGEPVTPAEPAATAQPATPTPAATAAIEMPTQDDVVAAAPAPVSEAAPTPRPSSTQTAPLAGKPPERMAGGRFLVVPESIASRADTSFAAPSPSTPPSAAPAGPTPPTPAQVPPSASPSDTAPATVTPLPEITPRRKTQPPTHSPPSASRSDTAPDKVTPLPEITPRGKTQPQYDTTPQVSRSAQPKQRSTARASTPAPQSLQQPQQQQPQQQQPAQRSRTTTAQPPRQPRQAAAPPVNVPLAVEGQSRFGTLFPNLSASIGAVEEELANIRREREAANAQPTSPPTRQR